MTLARRPADAAGPAHQRSEIAIIIPSTTATTATTWYAGAAGFTAVRRSRARVRLPTRGRPGHTVVALHGDLDIASAPALREHLIGTLRHSAPLLILDLDEVSFCDAVGLGVLIGAQRRATGLGITVHLANPPPQVAKLLRITGLDRYLTVAPARDSSLHSRPGGRSTAAA